MPLLRPRGGISRHECRNIAAAVGFDATDQPPALRQGEGLSTAGQQQQEEVKLQYQHRHVMRQPR
jgi:hypothetical protein